MRCDKMHATIAVRQCLANQKKLAGDSPFVKSLRYPGCKDCPTGRLAAKGKLDDDDLRTILGGYHGRMHPPEDVVTAAETGTLKPATEEETREGAMAAAEGQQQTKECRKCKKPKPIERFSRSKNGEEKRKRVCMDCEAAYQRERKARIKAAAAEEQRMRHDVKLIEDHAEAARQRMEEQAEPAPAQNETGNWKLETGGQPGFEIHQEAHGQDAHATISSNQLTLDFSCYPEVLKEIKRIAHHEERSPEVQARFMLKRLLQLGHDDKDRLGFENRVGLSSQYQPMFIGIHPAVGRDETAVDTIADEERACA